MCRCRKAARPPRGRPPARSAVDGVSLSLHCNGFATRPGLVRVAPTSMVCTFPHPALCFCARACITLHVRGPACARACVCACLQERASRTHALSYPLHALLCLSTPSKPHSVPVSPLWPSMVLMILCIVMSAVLCQQPSAAVSSRHFSLLTSKLRTRVMALSVHNNVLVKDIRRCCIAVRKGKPGGDRIDGYNATLF